MFHKRRTLLCYRKVQIILTRFTIGHANFAYSHPVTKNEPKYIG